MTTALFIENPRSTLTIEFAEELGESTEGTPYFDIWVESGWEYINIELTLEQAKALRDHMISVLEGR